MSYDEYSDNDNSGGIVTGLFDFIGGLLGKFFGLFIPHIKSEAVADARAPEVLPVQNSDAPSRADVSSKEKENSGWFDTCLDVAGAAMGFATNVPVIGNAIASGGQFALGGVRLVGDMAEGKDFSTAAKAAAEDEAAAAIDLIPFGGDVVAAGRVARIVKVAFKGTSEGVAKLGLTMQTQKTVDGAMNDIMPSNTPASLNSDVAELKGGAQ